MPSPSQQMRMNAKTMCSQPRMAFPLRALIDRINHNEAPPWASYLNFQRAKPSSRDEQCQEGLPHLLGAAKFSPYSQNQAACCGGQRTRLERGAPCPSSSCPQVTGRVWELSQDAQGCREVQLAIDCAVSDESRAALAAELQGHVLEAMRCPHANHVLQKCITSTKPHVSQFIVDEILASPGAAELAARHKYGCRIVQRLLEHCLQEQVEGVAQAVLGDVLGIARHPYGNYVLQNLLTHGTALQKHELAEALNRDIAPICQDAFGSAVVAFALSTLDREDAVSLARAILQESGLLAFMAHSRHGHSAVRLILQALDGPDLKEATKLLRLEMASLKVSRYGRVVATWLDAEICSDGPGGAAAAVSA
eukprot:gb/GFBE01043654.1/.p1 GENE.gb/GFBE01043654.1/~~gb/GFBE01043654.1/.p1  ORF type:complete len:365 (+),score=63.14 gb/GFBE01043654.1/:1-1095(+)